MRLILFSLCLTTLVQAYSQDLRITCTSVSDTNAFSKPILLRIELKNISKRSVQLPEGFSVSSNYLPNGLAFPKEGILLYFEISPVSPKVRIYKEGLTTVVPSKFYRIAPGKKKEIIVDIAPHLNYANDYLKKEDNDSIPINVRYSIVCNVSTLIFSKKSKTSVDHVKSNPTEFYLKGDPD